MGYQLLEYRQLQARRTFKGEVSPNNNVDWVSRKQFYKPDSKSLSRIR